MENTSSNQADKKTASRTLFVLLLAVVIDLLGFGLVIPFLPFWVTDTIGASETTYGILLASYSFFQFIFAPFWGRLSDRKGRRPVILIGLSGSILGYGLLAVNALFFPTSLELLFLSRFVQGTFTAATLPTSQAYISDTSTGQDRTRKFGLLGTAFGFGFAIGPALGGILSGMGELLIPSIEGYWAPALFATGLAVINLLAAMRNIPESLSEEKRLELVEIKKRMHASSGSRLELVRTIGANPAIFVIIVLFASVSLAFSNLQATLVLLGEANFNLDATGAGFLFLIMGGTIIIVQGRLLGPLSSRFSDTVLMASGIFLLIFPFLYLPSVDSFVMMVVLILPVAIGQSLNNPTLGALLSKQSPRDRQGSILGVNQGMASLMRIIGPILGGFLFEIDLAYPYYFGTIMLVIAFILALYLVRIVNERSLNHIPLVSETSYEPSRP